MIELEVTSFDLILDELKITFLGSKSIYIFFFD